MHTKKKTSSLFGILQNDAILGEQSLILHYTKQIGKFTHRTASASEVKFSMYVEDTDQPLVSLDCLVTSKRKNIGADH